MGSCSSRQIIGPIDTEIIMNHFRAFTNPDQPRRGSQEDENEIREAGIMSSDYRLSMHRQLAEEEKSAMELEEKKRGETMANKKYVPFFHRRELYFEVHDKDEQSSFKEAAKPSPSLTSLNRELSTVSFTNAQLVALIGTTTLHYLLSQEKTENSLDTRSVGEEFTQEERNNLRTALEMLSHVEAKTLQEQHCRIATMASRDERDKRKSSENAETPNVRDRYNGEIANMAAALPDEIMMQSEQAKEMESFGEGKEIQGAAELCIRPSKIEAMKSDTELDMKYKALAEEAQSKRDSAEDSDEQGSDTDGKRRHAAGNSSSMRSLDQNNECVELSSRYALKANDNPMYGPFCNTRSSFMTTSIYSSTPTAITCSYSTDSMNSLQKSLRSVDSVSDSWWADENIVHSSNSLSTAIRLSDCSDALDGPCVAQNNPGITAMTADPYTEELNTAEAGESDIEATNRIFDILLNAKSESFSSIYIDQKGTALPSDLVTAGSSPEEWKRSLSGTYAESSLSHFDVEDIRTAISQTNLESAHE